MMINARRKSVPVTPRDTDPKTERSHGVVGLIARILLKTKDPNERRAHLKILKGSVHTWARKPIMQAIRATR